MIRKLKALAVWGAGIGLALGLGLSALAAPALATDNGTVTPVNNCLNKYEIKKWYGHDDEATLFANVSSTEAGLRFNGASLAHRDLDPSLKLADAPKHALLTAVDTAETTGVDPLVKFRTDAPFSTLNIDADGKWWSSKINPTDEGGISNPVNGPADLVGLPLTKVAPVGDPPQPVTYTEETTIEDIQIGYASDTGNVATVKSLVYNGKTYAFACPKMVATPGPSQTGSASPKPRPSVIKNTPTKAPELALTGSDTDGVNPLAILIPMGSVLVLAGGGAILMARERRQGRHRA